MVLEAAGSTPVAHPKKSHVGNEARRLAVIHPLINFRVNDREWTCRFRLVRNTASVSDPIRGTRDHRPRFVLYQW